MADDILFVMANATAAISPARSPSAAIRSTAATGAARGDHPFLHFEVCYHQAIDFAIAKGLKRRSRGAGEHAGARLPADNNPFRPLHHPCGPSAASAVADYLERERRDVEMMGDYLAEHGPFAAAETTTRQSKTGRRA